MHTHMHTHSQHSKQAHIHTHTHLCAAVFFCFPARWRVCPYVCRNAVESLEQQPCRWSVAWTPSLSLFPTFRLLSCPSSCLSLLPSRAPVLCCLPIRYGRAAVSESDSHT